jgi:hypothetical protein
MADMQKSGLSPALKCLSLDQVNASARARKEKRKDNHMSVSTMNEYTGMGLWSRIGAFFSRVFAAIIRGREAQGRRYVALHLSQFDDRTLENAGIKREDILQRPRDLAAF